MQFCVITQEPLHDHDGGIDPILLNFWWQIFVDQWETLAGASFVGPKMQKQSSMAFGRLDELNR